LTLLLWSKKQVKVLIELMVMPKRCMGIDTRMIDRRAVAVHFAFHRGVPPMLFENKRWSGLILLSTGLEVRESRRPKSASTVSSGDWASQSRPSAIYEYV